MPTLRSRLQHRSFCLVQDLQPQYAAYLAISAVARHVVPKAGDNVLTVDVGGGLQAEQSIFEILASDAVVSGNVACSRIGSTLELISANSDHLGELVSQLEDLVDDNDSNSVEIANSLLHENIGFDYANLINQSRKGALLVEGDSVLILECSRAEKVGVLANQIECQYPGIALVNIDHCSGQLMFSGDTQRLKSIQSEWSYQLSLSESQ